MKVLARKTDAMAGGTYAAFLIISRFCPSTAGRSGGSVPCFLFIITRPLSGSTDFSTAALNITENQSTVDKHRPGMDAAHRAFVVQGQIC